MSKSFYRKVGFGLGQEDKVQSDPLKWAYVQLDEVPPFTWGGAILMAGGLLKKAQVHTDWPGLKKKDLYEGRDLLSTLDARAVYLSAMAVCFNVEPELLRREVFWGENLSDLTASLFKI